MQVSSIGASAHYDLMEMGTLFVANDGDFKTYFIKVSDNQTIGAVCLKTDKEPSQGYNGRPGFYSEGLFKGYSFFSPSNIYFTIDENSLVIDGRNPSVGDVILINNEIFLCAQFGRNRIIVDVASGMVVNLDNGLPRAIFEKWSLVRRVGDVETTLLEYPGA